MENKKYINEDELPEMTDEEYSEWYKSSYIVDGVRVGEVPKEKIRFILNHWDEEYSFFLGYKNERGRYTPLKRYKIDKYRPGYIEIENRFKGCEFFETEIKILQ